EAAFEASWPAAEYAGAGVFRIGRGLGGGRRVSSARALHPGFTPADIDAALKIHAGWDQPAIFRVSDGDTALAEALSARGLQARMPTQMMTAPLAALTTLDVPPVTSFAIWPPLAIQRDLWAGQGIGAARQAVMARAHGPKTALLGRINDRAAAVAFAAVSGGIAVFHALEVLPGARRQGLAGWMLREAAFWATRHGAQTMLLAVTAGNAPAIALYHRLGFTRIAGYRYFQP
ncbi:MAG: GNAT family N-acetyltransferase, partial [Paracoccus sp. (in: a-proteobacteria)]|nr:GNAT family N-acetyltransferase [Paracoccus sp. (in: a-proteobacteria)]